MAYFDFGINGIKTASALMPTIPRIEIFGIKLDAGIKSLMPSFVKAVTLSSHQSVGILYTPLVARSQRPMPLQWRLSDC